MMGREGEKRKTVTPVRCGKYYEGWYTVCGEARRGRTAEATSQDRQPKRERFSWLRTLTEIGLEVI